MKLESIKTEGKEGRKGKEGKTIFQASHLSYCDLSTQRHMIIMSLPPGRYDV